MNVLNVCPLSDSSLPLNYVLLQLEAIVISTQLSTSLRFSIAVWVKHERRRGVQGDEL